MKRSSDKPFFCAVYYGVGAVHYTEVKKFRDEEKASKWGRDRVRYIGRAWEVSAAFSTGRDWPSRRNQRRNQRRYFAKKGGRR